MQEQNYVTRGNIVIQVQCPHSKAAKSAGASHGHILNFYVHLLFIEICKRFAQDIGVER